MCVSVCARPYYVLRAWDLGGTCVHVKWRPVLIMSLFVSCQSAAVHIHHVQGRTASTSTNHNWSEHTHAETVAKGRPRNRHSMHVVTM